MSFSNIIKPRPEVLKKDGIDSVIDIENLRSKRLKAVESRPKDFFDLTYPTSDIRFVVEHLHRRFMGKEAGAGTYLLEGYKGSGKSHLELFVYHLLNSPNDAQEWLLRNDLECALPKQPVTVIRKFTDFHIDTLWNWIFDELGDRKNMDRPPDLDQFRRTLAGRQLILILDELEMGIKSIPNEASRAQNLAFIQMLSEEAQRSESATVTVFASVYDSNQEAGATLKRVSPVNIRFMEPQDRRRIIQHRLFAQFEKRETNRIDQVIQSYVNEWKRHDIQVDERHIESMRESFPFSPELLDTVLYRVPAKGGFQANRGALGLLGTVVRLTHNKTDLITTAHLAISEPTVRNKLADLDPAQNFLDCAGSDFNDLKELSVAEEIISSVLVASLAPAGQTIGITEMELKRQIIEPGDDINVFSSTLHALEKLGTYFQHQEDRYFFDTHEKPNAKVEYRSLRIERGRAIDYALTKWKVDLFKDPEAVVYRDRVQVNEDLSMRDAKRIRFVLSPFRLNEDERRNVFHGQQNQNIILLLEPRTTTFNALEHPDIIKWGQRALAAQELIPTAESDRRKHYEKILAEDTRWIIDTIKRTGLHLVWIQDYGVMEEENLGNASTRDDVLKQLRDTIFPRQRFEEHIKDHIKDFFGQTVRSVDAIYRKTLGYPIRTADSTIPDAIRELCKSGVLGLIHERAKACGTTFDLSSMELLDATISEPFEEDQPAKMPFTEGLGFKDHTDTKSTTIIDKSPIYDSPVYSYETLQLPFTTSIHSLRQGIASRLENHPQSQIHKATFYILMKHSEVELSSLSAAVRGSLSGKGSIVADITISRVGVFSKAAIEQMVEQLPSFEGAQYGMECKIETVRETVSSE